MYIEVMTNLREHVLRVTGHVMRPRQFVVDYELALLNAIRAVFPNSPRKGCYFHFVKSLVRKVRALGLIEEYAQEGGETGTFLRHIMSLGYIPADQVRQTYFDYINEPGNVALRQNDVRLNRYLRYFERTYLDGVLTPDIWNTFERDENNSTNNVCEGM